MVNSRLGQDSFIGIGIGYELGSLGKNENRARL